MLEQRNADPGYLLSMLPRVLRCVRIANGQNDFGKLRSLGSWVGSRGLWVQSVIFISVFVYFVRGLIWLLER